MNRALHNKSIVGIRCILSSSALTANQFNLLSGLYVESDPDLIIGLDMDLGITIKIGYLTAKIFSCRVPVFLDTAAGNQQAENLGITS